jgi:hypothetical protein
MASNLLTLPRGICNTIYPYLSHTLEFEWPWRPMPVAHIIKELCPEISHGTVQVYLHHVHDPSALSTHPSPRTRDEYLDEAHMSPLEAIIVVEDVI